MNWVKPLVIVCVIIVAIAVPSLMYVGSSNSEVELRNAGTAQQKANEVVFEKMKKVIFQQAQVASKYTEEFSNVYHKMMSARYEGKDPMMNWITEHNPSLDASMYKVIQTSIAALRAEFANVQKRLIDIKREHDNLRMRIPSCWFVGGRDSLKIQIVTSTDTKQTFETGVEDNADIF